MTCEGIPLPLYSPYASGFIATWFTLNLKTICMKTLICTCNTKLNYFVVSIYTVLSASITMTLLNGKSLWSTFLFDNTCFLYNEIDAHNIVL